MDCIESIKNSIINFNGLKSATLLYLSVDNKEIFRYLVPFVHVKADKNIMLLYSILYQLASLDCIPAMPFLSYKQTNAKNEIVSYRPTIHFLYPKNKARQLIDVFRQYNKTSFVKIYDYETEQDEILNSIENFKTGAYSENGIIFRSILDSGINLNYKPTNNLSLDVLGGGWKFNDLLIEDLRKNAVAIDIADLYDPEMENKMFLDLFNAAKEVYFEIYESFH